MPRDFDVILYGATGFTGRQTVAYFNQHAPPNLRWAIAGRNKGKLEALDAHATVLVSGSASQDEIDAIVSRTRVLASVTSARKAGEWWAMTSAPLVRRTAPRTRG